MNTKQALIDFTAQMPDAKRYLDNRKEIYQKAKTADVRAEIRGFLAALRIIGQISDAEFKALFTYYTL